MTDQTKTALRAPVADSTLPLEQALSELVNKIDTGLDTGDLLQDARRASTALDAIMASAQAAGEALQVATVAMQLIRRSPLDAFDRQQHDKLVQDFAALHERPNAAPQASEAECSCPSGNGSLRHPWAVHPQTDRGKASLGIPDCGGPLCGPAHHHPLCRVATGDGEEY